MSLHLDLNSKSMRLADGDSGRLLIIFFKDGLLLKIKN